MPKQPSWLDRVNFIRFWLENDCDFPWTVYFETAWPALGKFSLELVSFGLSDIIRGRFAPAAQRQGRHGRKGRRSGKGGSAIPEVGNMIGGIIPAPDDFEKRALTQGQRNLWSIDRNIQRHNYFWLLLDVVGNFWYDWASSIVMDPRTSCPNIGRALAVNEEHVTRAGGWGSTNVGSLVYQEGPVSMHSFAVSLGPGRWQIAMAAKVRPATAFDAEVEVQLGLNSEVPPIHFYDVSERVTVPWPSQAQLCTAALVQSPVPFEINFREYTQGGFARWTEITTRVMQMDTYD